ncbi:MAG: hypothetical protein ACRCVU_13895 [Flavobacterium sp.]
MTKVRVIDIEADGLKPTVIHCAVAMSLDGKEVERFEPHQMKEFCEFLDTLDVFIGHNIISYDLPAIESVLGYTYKGAKVDTLLMSRLQNPKRPYTHQAKDKKKAMAVHGLYSWGVRVGIDKPDIDNWEVYTPEILHRCEEDVKINVKVYHALMEEGARFNWRNAHLLTFKLFENLERQRKAGWKLDIPHVQRSLQLCAHWVGRIDRLLEEALPYTCEVMEVKKEGEYGWVRKPFMKSGAYSGSVVKQYGDDSNCVGGPFSRVCFRKIKLGSDAEVKKFLLAEGWIPDAWNTDDEGNNTSPKLNKDTTFDGVTGSAGKFIVLRSRINDRASIMEGYLRNVRPDGRIESQVSGLADTRRMKHKQVVNVPNGDAFLGPMMRKCFIARDGYKLVGVDAAGCQDRMLASRANDDGLTKILLEGDKEKGTDAHTMVMKRVNKICDMFKVPHIKRGAGKNIGFG